MKITHVDDLDAGTTTLTITFPANADPEAMPDVAWTALHRILDRRRRGLGTIPERMRDAVASARD